MRVPLVDVVYDEGVAVVEREMSNYGTRLAVWVIRLEDTGVGSRGGNWTLVM